MWRILFWMCRWVRLLTEKRFMGWRWNLSIVRTPKKSNMSVKKYKFQTYTKMFEKWKKIFSRYVKSINRSILTGLSALSKKKVLKPSSIPTALTTTVNVPKYTKAVSLEKWRGRHASRNFSMAVCRAKITFSLKANILRERCSFVAFLKELSDLGEPYPWKSSWYHVLLITMWTSIVSSLCANFLYGCSCSHWAFLVLLRLQFLHTKKYTLPFSPAF